VNVRPAGPDEADTLLAIQREAAVDAFAHIYPPERYPFPDDAVRRRAGKLAATVLAKPFSRAQLRDAVREAVRRTRGQGVAP